MPGLSAPTVPAELARGIKVLEPLPVTAQRLFQLLKGEDVSLSQVADVIEFDPTTAAAVLREASTVRYAGHGLTTVRDAALRLGTAALLNLVFDRHIATLRAATPMYDLSEHDHWLHGAAAQLAVRAIKKECPRAGIPELADTAAMMHDIGKLITSRYLKVEAEEILALTRAKTISFVDAERHVLGTDHAQIGAAVAEHWQVPREIVEAIRYHHAPGFGTPAVMTYTVAMANLVAKTIGTGLGAEGLNLHIDPQTYRRLGINFSSFGRVCLQTEEWLRELVARHDPSMGHGASAQVGPGSLHADARVVRPTR